MSSEGVNSVGGSGSGAVRRARLEQRLHELGLARPPTDFDREARTRATEYMRRAATTDRLDISGGRAPSRTIRSAEEAARTAESSRIALQRGAELGASSPLSRANELELIELLSG